MTARAHLESLLRSRKLDVTLTSEAPWDMATADKQAFEDRVTTGIASLDSALGGGLRRGHLSEIVGARSSGRSAVLCGTLAAAAAGAEAVALIDTHDRFDPASAAAADLDLSRLLWVRETGDAARALKAMNLVLQAGGFGVVAFDLADVPAPMLRALPFTTWRRISRAIEGSQTAAVLIGAEHIARSPGGVTIAIERLVGGSPAVWAGGSSRARFLHAIELRPRVIGARNIADC
jgi:hypothetical protein